MLRLRASRPCHAHARGTLLWALVHPCICRAGDWLHRRWRERRRLPRQTSGSRTAAPASWGHAPQLGGARRT